MRLHVVHETHYRYSSPVLLSQQLLHLAPRNLPWQQCLSHAIQVQPEPGEFAEREDFFGNRAARLLIATPHQELLVHAASTLELAPREQAALALPRAPWERSREAARAQAAAFVYESPHVETWREIAEYGAQSFARGRAALEGAMDLARRIHEDFQFDRTATSVSTPLREVMKRRRGVCQDFAHLMIAALRMLGLAARYVSGYLLTHPPPGQEALVGADASHAWVQVWCPDTPGLPGGWLELDPTNDQVPELSHVRLALGRDYGDVTPLRGVIRGGGRHTLEVAVNTRRVQEPQARMLLS